MKELNAWVLDVETSPMTVYVFDRRDQNIGLNQIQKDWSIIAWSAKKLGAPASEIIYRDARNARDLGDDKQLLKPLWKILDDAEIVIGQNSKAFDTRVVNARFILNHMPPPSPYQHIDTYLMARATGRFTSNSLEYLTDKLCVKYKKLTHSKFPGQALWNGCLAGVKAAWDTMREYNIHDVLSTEELYGILKPWAPKNTPDVFTGGENTLTLCGTCGEKCERRGYQINRSGQFPRYHCTHCGRWKLGKKTKEIKK